MDSGWWERVVVCLQLEEHMSNPRSPFRRDASLPKVRPTPQWKWAFSSYCCTFLSSAVSPHYTLYLNPLNWQKIIIDGWFLKIVVMDEIVSSQNLYFEVLMPNVLVLGGGAFGR